MYTPKNRVIDIKFNTLADFKASENWMNGFSRTDVHKKWRETTITANLYSHLQQ